MDEPKDVTVENAVLENILDEDERQLAKVGKKSVLRVSFSGTTLLLRAVGPSLDAAKIHFYFSLMF